MAKRLVHLQFVPRTQHKVLERQSHYYAVAEAGPDEIALFTRSASSDRYLVGCEISDNQGKAVYDPDPRKPFDGTRFLEVTDDNPAGTSRRPWIAQKLRLNYSGKVKVKFVETYRGSDGVFNGNQDAVLGEVLISR